MKKIMMKARKISDTEIELEFVQAKITTISTRISKEESEKIDKLAKKLGISKSELIREAIKFYIKYMSDKHDYK